MKNKELNVEEKKKLTQEERTKQTNSNMIVALLALSIIVVILVGLVVILRDDVKKLNDEIIHVKEVLSEYGIYTDEQPSQDTSYDTSGFNVIKPSDIAKESKGKTIVLWVGRQSCGYCGMYAPYITEAMNNYGIKAYYVDLATMIEFNTAQPYITDEEQFGILSGLKGDGKWDGFAEENVGGTPLTLIIKDSKVIGGLSGYADTETVMQVFADAGLKKN